ncbi:hypothetical protein QBC34DRAFT_377095 [Podospora aff. communis PSN243]|uniref:TOM core complex subunit Tom6 n=1 Tax=Podospora aff. communis PSN243 TaxID=3040156 RepID=A0AAV9GWC4_9PEZI|nr:hypothetical protein QBC34DRAFT_377095 [Podospora aff. communis PSN243]
MAPKSRASKGIFASTYSTMTSPENAAVVKSVAAFGVAVAFLSSSWAEYILVQ